MKYVIELRKDGALRGELIRADEKEAKALVDEWIGRGCGNTAEYRQEARLWYAVYFCGDLDCVVSDEDYDEKNRYGQFRGDGWEWVLVKDGKFYETLREAIHTQLKEYGY